VGQLVVALGAILAAFVAVGTLVSRRRRQRDAVALDAIVASRRSTSLDVWAVLGHAPASPDGIAARPWERLDAALDLATFRPKLAADVEIRTFRMRWGNDYAMAYNPRSFIHNHLEVWEAELLPRMDGTRTVPELVVDRLDATGRGGENGITHDADGTHGHPTSLRPHRGTPRRVPPGIVVHPWFNAACE
jgi:hypothetical protein